MSDYSLKSEDGVRWIRVGTKAELMGITGSTATITLDGKPLTVPKEVIGTSSRPKVAVPVPISSPKPDTRSQKLQNLQRYFDEIAELKKQINLSPETELRSPENLARAAKIKELQRKVMLEK